MRLGVGATGSMRVAIEARCLVKLAVLPAAVSGCRGVRSRLNDWWPSAAAGRVSTTYICRAVGKCISAAFLLSSVKC